MKKGKGKSQEGRGDHSSPPRVELGPGATDTEHLIKGGTQRKASFQKVLR